MKAKKIFLFTTLIAMIAMLVPASQLWAGVEGGDPPDGDKVTGPEVWATVVVYCDPDPDYPNFVAIRAKRIKDCIVQTQGIVQYPGVVELPTCPDNSGPFLYYRLAPGTVFPADPDIPQTFKPIITKIKNFKKDNYVAPGDTGILSFDAQIKFVDEPPPPTP